MSTTFLVAATHRAVDCAVHAASQTIDAASLATISITDLSEEQLRKDQGKEEHGRLDDDGGRTNRARASLFSHARSGDAHASGLPDPPLGAGAAARLLLASTFHGGEALSKNGEAPHWTTQPESLVRLILAQHETTPFVALAPSRIGALIGPFAAHSAFAFPDDAAPLPTTPMALPGQPPRRAPPAQTTAVHRLQLTDEARAVLLPALLRSAFEQRAAAPEGVQVSNVGGWHSKEQVFEKALHNHDPGASALDLEPQPPWYTELRQVLVAAQRHLADEDSNGGRIDGTPVEDLTIAGWINSSGPAAFNALHDHGRDVLFSIVLFVATGEEAKQAEEAEAAAAAEVAEAAARAAAGAAQEDGGEEAGKDDDEEEDDDEDEWLREAEAMQRGLLSCAEQEPCGGSLLLKTQLGAAASGSHGYVQVAPTPGEMWCFPGYMPHCVLPRVFGPLSPTDASSDKNQRVSVAVNIYSSASTDALSFIQGNMAPVLHARDQASRIMQALGRRRA